MSNLLASPLDLVVLVALGVTAGAVTTTVGMGGGLLLIVVLSAQVGPKQALALSAIPLLLGNVQRAYLYREALDRRRATAFCAGAAPAALVVGWSLATTPAVVIRSVLVALTVFALLQGMGLIRWQPRPVALMPAGAAIGGLTATAGGAGILTAPLLMASGLRGGAYLATASAIAATMHLARLTGYGAAGLVHRSTFAGAAALALAVMGGNLAGRRLRQHVPPRWEQPLIYGVLVLCVAAAVLGIG
ncbi:MAG: sulfite exporter TauE/SafE family protein [Myxococcales bacterium]|nr:sulfite exporter TauE/SafE family protein [Myxococcales bacterium]